MSLRIILQRLLRLILPLSIASTIYLYLYPVFHGCAFPLPRGGGPINSDGSRLGATIASYPLVNTLFQHLGFVSEQSSLEPEPAIFRLLVLADPQIEGDTSLPAKEDEFIPRLERHWRRIVAAWKGEVSAEEEQREREETDIPIVNALESILGVDDADGAPEARVSAIRFSFISTIASALRTIVLDDLPSAVQAARKRLDLLGNDFYLAHIYRTLGWWSRPTHVAVLGDLIGSQWVTDAEFERRGWRYWHRVFRGGEKVSDKITSRADQGNLTLQRYNSSWSRKIINIAGNHDIGYAGDVSAARLERFERVFGQPNWDIRFRHPPRHGDGGDIQPTIHIVTLNDLVLDGPALDDDILTGSYNFINDVILHRSHPVEDRTSFTLLLTHVPLYKPEGVCVDGPHFAYWEFDDEWQPENPRFHKDGLREQNHLSKYVSANSILQALFGMRPNRENGRGRNGLILTGHDHEGCDVVHSLPLPQEEEQEEGETRSKKGPVFPWAAIKTPLYRHQNRSAFEPALREITLRSMMGEYGGNAGLLSLWFDFDAETPEWKYEIQTCRAGVQHIWWAVHVVDFLTLMGSVFVVVLSIYEGAARTEAKKTIDRVKKEHL
ncbi:hypothetical protein VTN31DRAFT_2891 [Thermomyces dupontii]|uniref:uncharacterized protein n=1 Tax=Talaromyces thermophilus TaxID=28565 RepID=UPI003744B01E